jgi:hypothetical protein
MTFSRINFILFCIVTTYTCSSLAQVGIGTSSPNAAAELDITSTSKGVLFPRMTNAQMKAISSPVQGLQVYNSDANCMYYYNGTQWLSTLNSITAVVNAGTAVQLDNIKIRIPTSGNRSMQIATVSGTIYISGTAPDLFTLTIPGTTGIVGSTSAYSIANIAVSTSFSYVASSADFPFHGSVQRFLFCDNTNRKSYRVTWIVGNGYNNNIIEIERIY